MKKADSKSVQSKVQNADPEFSHIVSHYADVKGIVISKMFGSTALKFKNKVFVMVVKGDLVVKIPKSDVERLVSEGVGKHFDPGHGKLMKEWVTIGPKHKDLWLEISKQAKDFVS
jgi:TfoX/Sxy family transcriptional regulator of competence genes